MSTGRSRNAIRWGLSVPVAQAMAAQVQGRIDFGVWGSVVQNLAYANLAREIWLDAKLDPHVPTFTTIMQCSTSMAGVFQAAGILAPAHGARDGRRRREHDARADRPHPNFSVWLRKMFQARDVSQRLALLRQLAPLRHSPVCAGSEEPRHRPQHGRAHRRHGEDWKIGRAEQDELSLQGHQRAIAAQDRGFFNDLIIPLDGVTKDHFPRRDTSQEKLARLKPVFDRTSRQGTLTAGNSSPLTDGAAAIWVATDEGLARLPASVPRVRLIDFEQNT